MNLDIDNSCTISLSFNMLTYVWQTIRKINRRVYLPQIRFTLTNEASTLKSST